MAIFVSETLKPQVPAGSAGSADMHAGIPAESVGTSNCMAKPETNHAQNPFPDLDQKPPSSKTDKLGHSPFNT
jgi:hypothetical protein